MYLDSILFLIFFSHQEFFNSDLRFKSVCFYGAYDRLSHYRCTAPAQILELAYFITAPAYPKLGSRASGLVYSLEIVYSLVSPYEISN